MKKTVSYICLLALLFVSCDDFFEPAQKGKIPVDEYNEGLNNLRLTLNTIYSVLQSKDYQLGELVFGEAMSDNCWNAEDVEVNDLGRLLNFQFDTDNPYILTRYSINYLIINMCNQIITAVPAVKYRPNGNSEVEIREVYGQAKLLRALAYFNLVKTYGGISIMPEKTNLEKLIVPRSSVAETYAYIEQDLRESLLLLRRIRYQNENTGQAGIGAGLGLLIKTLVYQASPGLKLNLSKREQKWQEALEIGQFFLEGKDRTFNQLLKFDENYEESWDELSARLFLDPLWTKETIIPGQDVVSIHQLDNFDRIFRVEGEFCSESLLEINHYDFSVSGISGEEGWALNPCITDHSSGNPEIKITPTSDLNDQFANDPRGIFTISGRTINNYYKQETSDPAIRYFNIGNSLLFTKYYVFPSEGNPKIRNYRIMRYAEILLLYAEALNETGNATRAVDYVNMIRNRARKLLDTTNPNAKYNSAISAGNFVNQTYVPYDIVKNAIQKEKRVEMAGEFDRWFELCRLGIIAERMTFIANNPPVEPSGLKRIRGKHFKKGINEIFPIPQREVLISNGVIEQNFGY